MPKWTALAQLDTVDLGLRLGLLFDQEAERRRAEVRATFSDVEL